MQIREGAYYRTRGGHVFGPMVWDKDPTINYPWHIVSTEPEVCWDKRGFWLVTGTSQLDLISEVYVSDTPPADAPAPGTIRLDPRAEWKLFRQMGPHELVTNAPAPMLETKTLRDEFAGRVLTGMMADHTAPDRPPEFFADLAYKYADAMMEAREK
jgi:hypothetical protein